MHYDILNNKIYECIKFSTELWMWLVHSTFNAFILSRSNFIESIFDIIIDI